MTRRFSIVFRGVLLLLAMELTPLLSAAPTQFVLDPTQSQIALSGSVAGNTLLEQGPGSLVTSFSGQITAEVSGAAVQFPGGSALAAQTNGVWKPGPQGAAGSAPADFAAIASSFIGSVKGALRNLVLDLTSGPLPISNGQFDASALNFSFPTNSTASFDYDAGFLGAKGIALSGISTNKIVNGATLTSTTSGQTLTIQVDTEFKFKTLLENDSVVHLTGKLVATSTGAAAEAKILGIAVKGASVVLHVNDTGATFGLSSSTNLTAWALRTPVKSTDDQGTVWTLPLGGVQEFYRLAK